MRTTVPIAIFAIALYCYWPAAVPVSPCVVGYETLTTACSLAHNASFSDPFWIMPTGPTAHLAPLLPLVFSALFRLFGDGPDGLYAVHWVSSLTFALQVSLWPWVAESLGMGFASGVLGALAWLCVGYVLFPMWEAPQLAVLLPLLAVCAHRLLSRQVSTAFVFLVALLWAITFLFSPVPILVYLVLTGWIFALPRVPGIQKAAWLVVPFLLISPWLIRNYSVFHHSRFTLSPIVPS